MTLISWHGAVLRVPHAWITWTLEGIPFARVANGTIRACEYGEWRAVDHWNTFDEAEPAMAQDVSA